MLNHLPEEIRKQKLDYLKQKGFQAIRIPAAFSIRMIGNKKFLWELIESCDDEGMVIYATNKQNLFDVAIKTLDKYNQKYELKEI